MLKFLSSDIWKTIKLLSENSVRTQLAVAYFGNSSTRQLSLKKGDTLIVSMSLKNVKLGLVNPSEIETHFKNGVAIFTVSNLHSKIYLFDDKVIIGSANVSSYSEYNLLEAGILTDDPTILSNTKKYIAGLSIEKVEQDYINICKKNYSPPKNFTSIKGSKSIEPKMQLSRMWIASTFNKRIQEEDQKILDKELPKFKKKLADTKYFDVIDIEYSITASIIKYAREGDLIIEFFKHEVRVDVIKPQRVLGITINKNTNKAFLRIEARKTEIKEPWNKLEKLLRKHKIAHIKKNSTKEIKNEDTKKILLSVFNSNHKLVP